ncbi:MAG: hypothetical protein Q8M97_04340 [Methanobacteriaceae archaeon]|nr:hypothetical protein [Methanobacteriaceae archaeon]MDP3485090.1 hypothetical protein [Methanobacteriaceae archaeon]
MGTILYSPELGSGMEARSPYSPYTVTVVPALNGAFELNKLGIF